VREQLRALGTNTRHLEFVFWDGPNHSFSFRSWSGIMGVGGTFGDGSALDDDSGWQHVRDVNSTYNYAISPVSPGPVKWGFGFHLFRTVGPAQGGNWRVGGLPYISLFAPYWFLVIVFGTAPMVWMWRRWTRSERQSLSLCSTCGYDLRATPHRCPECGAMAK
jgi:hypothetical protein